MTDTIIKKLEVLASAAKYDVSCASSGSNRTNTKGGIGDAARAGICHSFTEDGRCISLLKLLFTNHCIYDCAFCISRRSNDIERAAFTIDEVVNLTINFYRRNYIEGLFLSSGVFVSPDYTMERLLQVVKRLRLEENFNGYIHLKTIPGASEELISEAGFYADRMSVNLELPTEQTLKLVAPDKSHELVKKDLGIVHNKIIAYKDERKLIKKVPKFVPAGQSTQLVIGAAGESDKEIMYAAHNYYSDFSLKRVYYSGYVPVNEDSRLPVMLDNRTFLRENRLYQTDWLIRLYGFNIQEILDDDNPFLDREVDPKLSWALRNMHLFPIDINTADYSMIMRIPGVGINSAKKIIQARQYGKLHIYQLQKIGIAYNRAKYFIKCADSPVIINEPESSSIRHSILHGSKAGKHLKYQPNQMNLFAV